MSWFQSRREQCYDNGVWVPLGKVRNWFVYVAAFVVRPVIKLVFRYRVHGAENIPKAGEGPVIFACNHVSYADPIVLWCLLYSYSGGCRFLARSSLFKPVLGGLIARVGAIPIDPESADRKALKRAAAALKRGEQMLIFPEGTRMNKPEKVYTPHAGVVLIAQMGKAKIVPVGISGTERIMPYGKPKFLRFPRVDVSFGKAVDPKDPAFDEVPKRERGLFIASQVMDASFALRDSVAR